MGALWAVRATHGEEDDKLYFDLLRLNGYIRTLCRNEKKFVHKKKKVPVTSVPFSHLVKHKSFLTLKENTKIVCEVTEIEPCLPENEVRSIVEKIKIMCPTCDCNCN